MFVLPKFEFISSSYAATKSTITEFENDNIPPGDITSGPDGNLWFTESSNIGQISTKGKITKFPANEPNAITTGPDGNLWFTGYSTSKVGKMTLSGDIVEFVVSETSINLSDITAGPDGNLWFLEYNRNKIGRITLGGEIDEFVVPTETTLDGIVAGPDGNLWFTETGAHKIGRITPNGVITEFPLPTGFHPSRIVKGPDGNLWFTELSAFSIGRITPSGVITEFPIPNTSSPALGITAGPDGNLWFTIPSDNKIGRITPAGIVSLFSIPTFDSYPFEITAGSDGNIWFTELTGAQIGRVDLSNLQVLVYDEYRLPYAPNINPLVYFTQGNNQTCINCSHNGKDKWAFDFAQPDPAIPGDHLQFPILAARSGIVFDIREDQLDGCKKINCPNYIVITHVPDDGTSDIYLHLKNNSVLPNVGDFVKRGCQIASTDDTGRSTDHHLHFSKQEKPYMTGWPHVYTQSVIITSGVTPNGFGDILGGIPSTTGSAYPSDNYPDGLCP